MLFLQVCNLQGSALANKLTDVMLSKLALTGRKACKTARAQACKLQICKNIEAETILAATGANMHYMT